MVEPACCAICLLFWFVHCLWILNMKDIFFVVGVVYYLFRVEVVNLRGLSDVSLGVGLIEGV